MDSSVVLSDDDYDLISNPASSIADLSHAVEPSPVHEVQELSVTLAARAAFESTRWSASDIQQAVRHALEAAALRARGGPSAGALAPTSSRNYDHRTVRVYVDGTFDLFNVGHALQLRQAKLSFPRVSLLVGVFPDNLLSQYGYTTTWPEVERVELVRHCRWVDEVTTEIPWEVTEKFIQQRRIDFVAVDEGSSVDPACDKARVRGYDEMRKLAKAIQTKRTAGLSATKASLLTSPMASTPIEFTVPEAVTPVISPPEFTAEFPVSFHDVDVAERNSNIFL